MSSMSTSAEPDGPIRERLRAYIIAEVLDGQPAGLDDRTPLLDWGLLNSIEMTRLVRFIEAEFNVHLAEGDVSPENFTDISSIAALIDAAAHRPAGAGR